jgi:hypothetical protein
MLDGILHGTHLLEFLFMIRKNGKVPPSLAIKQIQSMDLRFAIRFLSVVISNLPITVVNFLVAARSLASKWL